MELALGEQVEVAEKTSVWRSAKVRPVAGAAPADPILAAVLATVGEKECSAQDLVTRLGKGLTTTLGDRLADLGILERHDDKVLGLFPRTRWPAADTSHEQAVRRALTVVLVEGAEPDARTAPNVSPDGSALSFVRLGSDEFESALMTIDLATGCGDPVDAVQCGRRCQARLVTERQAAGVQLGRLFAQVRISTNVMTMRPDGSRRRAVTTYRGGRSTPSSGPTHPTAGGSSTARSARIGRR